MAEPAFDRCLSAFGRVRAEAGGKTGAMLARNRVLTEALGIPTAILTFDPATDYPATRRAFLARGELVEGMELLNLFEWFRDAGPEAFRRSDDDPAGRLPVLESDRVSRTTREADGVTSVVYRDRAARRPVARDHLRRDGSVFVRVAEPDAEGAGVAASRVWLVDHDGDVVQTWADERGWRRHWLDLLAANDRRTLLVTDTPTVLDQLWPLDDRFTLVHVLHEVHVRMSGTPTTDLWSAPLQDSSAPLFAHLDRLDALVLLTEHQRADVERRSGASTTRLAVLPHPVAPVDRPDPAPAREAATFVMLARLAPVKAVDRAISAFAAVVRAHPAARLLVYGKGPLHDDLAAQVEALGLGAHVELRGYDPGGQEALDTATAYLCTSLKESFGLGIVEAMAHGCPVVAYAVPYGPRALVDHDRDGYLVADGDEAELAQRITGLIESPADVARLSAGALAKARQFDPEAIARQWDALLDSLD